MSQRRVRRCRALDSPVVGNGLGQLAFVGGLDQFVDQFRGQRVADPEALLGRGGAQTDEQVRLSGAGIPNQT